MKKTLRPNSFRRTLHPEESRQRNFGTLNDRTIPTRCTFFENTSQHWSLIKETTKWSLEVQRWKHFTFRRVSWRTLTKVQPSCSSLSALHNEMSRWENVRNKTRYRVPVHKISEITRKKGKRYSILQLNGGQNNQHFKSKVPNRWILHSNYLVWPVHDNTKENPNFSDETKFVPRWDNFTWRVSQGTLTEIQPNSELFFAESTSQWNVSSRERPQENVSSCTVTQIIREKKNDTALAPIERRPKQSTFRIKPNQDKENSQSINILHSNDLV